MILLLQVIGLVLIFLYAFQIHAKRVELGWLGLGIFLGAPLLGSSGLATNTLYLVLLVVLVLVILILLFWRPRAS